MRYFVGRTTTNFALFVVRIQIKYYVLFMLLDILEYVPLVNCQTCPFIATWNPDLLVFFENTLLITLIMCFLLAKTFISFIVFINPNTGVLVTTHKSGDLHA